MLRPYALMFFLYQPLAPSYLDQGKGGEWMDGRRTDVKFSHHSHCDCVLHSPSPSCTPSSILHFAKSSDFTLTSTQTYFTIPYIYIHIFTCGPSHPPWALDYII
uniref:Secreted protein n=1 Tax=Echinococcus granulosus TaxID=6210 RepID=A0A068WUV2_ECHGR|nr:hypothetical protein EgrG_000179100 [Echinococcus granulosus]